MNTLISKLLMILNSEHSDSINFTIAKYILDHIDKVLEMPVNQLAEACYCSVNSIRKFCRYLGYESYARLKDALSSSLRTRISQIRERYALYDIDEMYRQIQIIVPETDIPALKQQIDQAADLIENFDTVAFCGANYPLMLTLNFQEDMVIFGKKVNVHKYMSGAIDENSLSKDELLFVITITGRLLNLNNGNKSILKRHNDHVILIAQRSSAEIMTNNIVVPGKDDDERYNVFLLYVFSLLKYTYLAKYPHKASGLSL